MGKHSNLGPSSAERWFNCPGSIKAIAKLETRPGSSIHAAEGSVAHDLAERYVTGKLSLRNLMGLVGGVAKYDGFDIEITEEMVDAVIEFYDTIQADVKSFTKPGPIVQKAETRVTALSVDPSLYGTADYLLYQRGNKLNVYDFKYGAGVPVEAVKNKQMATYALGAMDSEAGCAFDEIELIIVQPRAGGVKRWKTTVEWIKQVFGNEAREAVHATFVENPTFKAGKWCRWCPAAPSCPTAYEETQKQAMIDFSDAPAQPLAKGVLPDISTLPVEALVRALEHEEFVSSWFEAVRNHLKGMLEAGISVPGLKLVEGKVNRRWTDEAKVVAEFGPLFGEDALFEKKLLSPAKLEKIVGKGKVEHLTFKPEGTKSLAREDDPRPAAKNAAALDFTPVPATADALLAELETVPPTKTKPVKRIWPE